MSLAAGAGPRDRLDGLAVVPDHGDDAAAAVRELEAEALVERTVHPGPPVRVAYELTPKGRDLEAVVRALETWGQRWMSCRSSVAVGASAADDLPLG